MKVKPTAPPTNIPSKYELANLYSFRDTAPGQCSNQGYMMLHTYTCISAQSKIPALNSFQDIAWARV